MAMDKILKATVMLTAVDNMSRVIGGATAKAKNTLEGLQKSQSFKTFDNLGTGALVAGGAIAVGLGMAVKSAEEAQVATNRLNQVFKSMGETTGVAAAQASAYASTLAVQIGQEDELIMAAQAKLATFAAVSSETARMSGVFDRATKAAFDLAAAGFGEAGANAVQLGKALQDPIKGITALRKSGVTFTESEQAKIKALVQSGKLLEAQNIVLKAVETQVGGVAAATATDSAKMAIAFGEIAETAGAILLPMVQAITANVLPMLQSFQAFVSEHPGIVQAIAAIGAGLLAFGGVVKICTTATRIFAAVLAVNPFVLIAAAVIAVAMLIYANWTRITAFFANTWAAIKAGAASVGQFFVSVFTGMLDYVYALPSKMYDAGVNMITGLWNGIKAMAWAPVQAVADVASAIRDYFPFSPAKAGALRDIHKIRLVETIAASIKPGPIMKAVGGVTQSVANMGGGATITGGGGGNVTINFNPTVYMGAGDGAVQGDILGQLRAFIPMLQKELQTANERQQRKKF